MTDMDFSILKDLDDNGIPQFVGVNGLPKALRGDIAPYSQVVDDEGRIMFGRNNPGEMKVVNASLSVEVIGNKVSQQLTEADAVGNVLSFSKVITTVEFYNTDLANDGIFNANGINIKVPKGQGFKALIGGTPRATVTITGSTSYIVTAYE